MNFDKNVVYALIYTIFLALCSISCEVTGTVIFLCRNMRNNKNKHSGGISCSACKAFINTCRKKFNVCVLNK